MGVEGEGRLKEKTTWGRNHMTMRAHQLAIRAAQMEHSNTPDGEVNSNSLEGRYPPKSSAKRLIINTKVVCHSYGN